MFSTKRSAITSSNTLQITSTNIMERRFCRYYENPLYTNDHTPEMLDEIDNWMGLPKRQWREETQREVMLSLYAIRYPDTLLIESLTEKPKSDIRRLSAYLHFTHHTYSIWDEGTRKGLERLGIMIPPTKEADPFIYGAYVSALSF